MKKQMTIQLGLISGGCVLIGFHSPMEGIGIWFVVSAIMDAIYLSGGKR